MKTFTDEILELCEKATPGHWHYDAGNGDVESRDKKHWRIAVADRVDLMKRKSHCEHFELGYNPPDFPFHPDDDMELIARSRTLLPECARRLAFALTILKSINERLSFKFKVSTDEEVAVETDVAAVIEALEKPMEGQ